MPQVFNGQTNLTIELDTGISLASATVVKILYQDPDGTRGEWTGVVDGTKVVYAPAVDDITVEGVWRMQAYVEIGGEIAYGQIVQQRFTATLQNEEIL